MVPFFRISGTSSFSSGSFAAVVSLTKKVEVSRKISSALLKANPRTRKSFSTIMGHNIPFVKLNSGNEMPIFGLGTWRSKPSEVAGAVKHAIDVGYRLIDAAMVYENESEVGTALKAKLDEGVVTRDELFITSKLWCSYHQKESVVPALKKSLRDLGLDYLDLYLIHWPFAFIEDDGLFPKDETGRIILSDVDYLETWKGMEEAFRLGLTKSIGVSNFNCTQIQRLWEKSIIKPSNNQIEICPYFTNSNLITFCQDKGITVTGYSPLGGAPDAAHKKPDDPKLLEDEKIIELAQDYNKTPAQIALRWAVQRETVTIPKSVNKKRIEENINIFDFTLTNEDMRYVNTLDRGIRALSMPFCSPSPFYPFHIE